jgi:hypothetical protein
MTVRAIAVGFAFALSQVASKADSDLAARLAAQEPPSESSIEARWRPETGSEYLFLRFNPKTGAFLQLSPRNANLRTPKGVCLFSKPPFHSFSDVTGEADRALFDSAVDDLTLFFLLRSFTSSSEQILSVESLPDGASLIKTAFVNDTRSIPLEFHRKYPANKLVKHAWLLPQSFGFVEKRYLSEESADGRVVRFMSHERSPKGAWLMDFGNLLLRDARVVPYRESDYSENAVLDALELLSREATRKLVFSRVSGDGISVASPISVAESDALRTSSRVSPWRWPLLGAGALVIVAAWIARRRTA